MGRTVIRDVEMLIDAEASATIRGDIVIADGRIEAVGQRLATDDGDPAAEVIEGKDLLAIPGLVAAHTHSYTASLHATVPGEPLDLFVLAAMARRAPRSPRMVYLSAALHALQLARRGATALVDHFRFGAIPTVEAIEAAFAAYRDVGVRASIAPMYEDRVYVDALPFPLDALPAEVRARWQGLTKPAPEAYFALIDALLAWRGRENRLDVLLGVDGPQRCSARLLEMTGHYAERHSIGLHTHLLEAKTQALMASPDDQASLAARLDRYGLLNSRSSFAHFVWGNDRDIELMAARGGTVVHNPSSNLHLGSGIAPLARLLRAGIAVALGTDSDSGIAPSVLGEARLATLLSRVTEIDDARWVSARDALALATQGGARVLGRANDLGRIAPGYRADLTLIDTRGIEWRPRGEVFSHLVMYESGANVRTVLVEGEAVIRDGKAARVDQAALLAEAEALLTAENAANAPFLAAARAERDAFKREVDHALRRATDVERFVRLR